MEKSAINVGSHIEEEIMVQIMGRHESILKFFHRRQVPAMLSNSQGLCPS
jgi:hypothetical protein